MSRIKKILVFNMLIIFVLINSMSLNASALYDWTTFEYTIKKDDTLYLLAQRYDCSEDGIMSSNPKKSPDNLKIGDKLTISAGRGLIIHHVVWGDTLWKIAQSNYSTVELIAEKNYIENPDLIYAGDFLAVPQISRKEEIEFLSDEIVKILKEQNFKLLYYYVHPVKGIRFSPYSFVDVNNDLVFLNTQISNFAVDSQKYTWGVYDAIGEDIYLTPLEYYNRFIYNKDYASTGQISYNQIIGTGNTFENQFDVYPDSIIVEFYVPGTEGIELDYGSLRLVFEKYNGHWYLSAIIHNEWTI